MRPAGRDQAGRVDSMNVFPTSLASFTPSCSCAKTGGAGAKVELPELAYNHFPFTLGDWLALVAPQMQDLSQGASEWWEAKRLYEVWLKSTPERLQTVVSLLEALRGLRFVRPCGGTHREPERGCCCGRRERRCSS